MLWGMIVCLHMARRVTREKTNKQEAGGGDTVREGKREREMWERRGRGGEGNGTGKGIGRDDDERGVSEREKGAQEPQNECTYM